MIDNRAIQAWNNNRNITHRHQPPGNSQHHFGGTKTGYVIVATIDMRDFTMVKFGGRDGKLGTEPVLFEDASEAGDELRWMLRVPGASYAILPYAINF